MGIVVEHKQLGVLFYILKYLLHSTFTSVRPIPYMGIELKFCDKIHFFGILIFQIPSKLRKQTSIQEFLAKSPGSPCQQKGILKFQIEVSPCTKS